MLERINIVIILIAAVAVAVFDIAVGNSLFHLAVCLVITIIVFSIIGYFAKSSLVKWLTPPKKEENDDETLEELDEDE